MWVLVMCILGWAWACDALPDEDGNSEKMVACFWETGQYFPGFTSANIDTTLCSNIIYGYGDLDSNGWTIKHRNKTLDLDLGGFRNVSMMKQEHPGLKVSLAVGFWQTTEAYVQLARDPMKRESFAESSVAFLTEHRFDGLHLHWGMGWGSAGKIDPATKKGESWEDLPNLLKKLKEKFHPVNLTLSISLWSPITHVIDDHYNIAKLYKHADLVFVQFFGYHGSWEKSTDAFAPLRNTKSQVSDKNYLTVEFSWNYMKKRGALPCKTVMKIAMKSAEFRLKKKIPDIEDAVVPGDGLETVPGGGTIDFKQLCRMLREEEGWRTEWDEEKRTPFMWREDRWVSYEDRRSVQEKVNYANSEGMAGVAIEDLFRDDVMGECYNTGYPVKLYHPTNISYPLLRTMHDSQGGKCGTFTGARSTAGKRTAHRMLVALLMIVSLIMRI